MKYNNIIKATFLNRPNRFIANILVGEKEQICHVKNTGRCKELLTDNAVIYVQQNNNPNRKTKYDLIAVEKGNRLINMDSQIPNKVAYEWLIEKEPFGKITYIKPETKYKNSRFDFYFETKSEKAFAEIKGVTLEKDGIVLFPDAPSERAVKHLNELSEALSDGYKCYVIFIIQMDNVSYFTPNYQTHKAFGETLKKVQEKGIIITAIDCLVAPNSINYNQIIPIKF